MELTHEKQVNEDLRRTLGSEDSLDMLSKVILFLFFDEYVLTFFFLDGRQFVMEYF